jgi:hypothetical protein
MVARYEAVGTGELRGARVVDVLFRALDGRRKNSGARPYFAIRAPGSIGRPSAQSVVES